MLLLESPSFWVKCSASYLGLADAPSAWGVAVLLEVVASILLSYYLLGFVTHATTFPRGYQPPPDWVSPAFLLDGSILN